MTHDTVAASFILTWQLPRCQSAKVMHARAFGASRPAAPGARPARTVFDSIFQLKRAWKFASTVIDREATRVRLVCKPSYYGAHTVEVTKDIQKVSLGPNSSDSTNNFVASSKESR